MNLNEKQRNFLINILEKTTIYLLTIVIVGKIFNKEINLIQISGAIIIVVIFIMLGLIFAKEK